MTNLIDRIDETREHWSLAIKESQDALLDPPRSNPNILQDRLVVELDYLLVEAKIALERMNDDRSTR